MGYSSLYVLSDFICQGFFASFLVISLSCVICVLDTSVMLGSFYLFHLSEETA